MADVRITAQKNGSYKVEGAIELFYDDAKIKDERVAYYYRPLQTRGGQLAALRARTQAGEFPIEQDLNKINAPTLIIWGAEDALIPLEAGRKMNSLIKDSKLIVIEKCGHLPQEEMPERVLDEMTNFIEQSNQVIPADVGR